MKTKQFISAVLAFAMVFGVGTIFPKQAGFQQAELTASAEETGTYGDFTYTKYDTHIEITGCDKNAETVEIPSEIDGLPVTTIGGETFSECTSLTSVTIPNSVTTIKSDAFEECTSLTAIDISEQNPKYTSVDGIVYNKNITKLLRCPVGKTSVTIPDSVTTIEEDAFYYCTSLTSVTIPDSVTTIEEGAFYYCTSLTSVTIPDSVTAIGVCAFGKCTNLTSVTISNNVTTVAEWTFSGCTSLPSVTIPDSVTTISYGTFEECTHLTSVSIPESVTTIEKNAFSKCTSLTDVYYSGTEEQWNKIDSNNALKETTTIHYNSTAPETLEISVLSLIELNQKLKTQKGAPKKFDLNGDNVVNVIDLALLKQKLLNQ
ncbi:MAG: leucine-rich repeat protein [Oscillospiraceae bacterium]